MPVGPEPPLQIDDRTGPLEAANAELRVRHRQQSAVARLGQAAIGARDLPAFLEAAATLVAETLDTASSAIFEVRPEGDLLLRAGSRWPHGKAKDGAFIAPPGPGRDASTGILMVEIRGRARSWGVLGVHAGTPRTFAADELDFLESTANVLALVLERHDVEQRQRRETEMLQTIFDHIPVMISFYDASGRLLHVNREWERTLGWTFEEAQQADILTQVYPDAADRREAVEFMARAERRWADFRPRTRDGTVIESSWMQFRLSDGSSMGFGIDCADRKSAEADRGRLLDSERQARAAAEAALERLRAIDHITDTALHHLGLDELLRVLLARVRRALDADRVSLSLLDEAGEALYVRAADGVDLESVAGVRMPVGAGVTGRIAAEGRPRIVNERAAIDVTQIVGLPPADVVPPAEAVAGVPLLVGERVVGVVTVASHRPRQFTEEELKLLQLVADRVAPVIEQRRLLETVRAGEERLKALSRRLIMAQEEERRRLAIELHDELGQLLTAVKINLESLDRLAALPQPGQLQTMIDGVDRAMDRVRDLALDLRPSVLDDLGLPAALRWYLDRFARDTQLEAHVSIDAVPHLDPALETACFRVAQEALTNVARHARAKRVWLDLRFVADAVELAVRDDGIGFDVAAARRRAVAGGSLGLLGMHERVALVGGRYEIGPRPSGGTEVRARFPLTDAAPQS